MKFSNFMFQGWGFDSLFCRFLYAMIVSGGGGGGGVAPFKSCPGGWFWMKLLPALGSNVS